MLSPTIYWLIVRDLVCVRLTLNVERQSQIENLTFVFLGAPCALFGLPLFQRT